MNETHYDDNGQCLDEAVHITCESETLVYYHVCNSMYDDNYTSGKCSQNGHIQLVGIGFHKEVQICVNNSWHWINGDIIWNDKHASIVCRALDFSSYGIYMILIFF